MLKNSMLINMPKTICFGVIYFFSCKQFIYPDSWSYPTFEKATYEKKRHTYSHSTNTCFF